MSGYTIGEIIIWLFLAALLGFVLGWLLRTMKCEREHSAVGGMAQKAPAQAATLSSAAQIVPAKFAKSATPLAGGKAPSADYTIKGNADSMYFHTPDSPSYGRTIAEVWFKTEADARAAGFTQPGTGGATAKKATDKKATAAKKTPAKKASAAKKSIATKTSAAKAPAKKPTAAKTPAAKAPAKKANPAKAPAAKVPAKKAPAAKQSAKKAPAKKAVAPGKFPGSAKPLSGGRAPSAEYTIKGNEDSMIYHAPDSPSYGQTIAETWFTNEAAAVAAGFRKPLNA